MYKQFFQLTQAPFSIAPDPRYLFMSQRHREALAHLLYGVDGGGGFVLLTGEIGAGKTTICRCLLEQVPANCNVAYIFNPKLSVVELLQSVCEEFHIAPQLYGGTAASVKTCVDAINRFLLAAHAEGRNNVLIIDEAQNLSSDVLEQLRLLTNLETNERKLLQIILIGQPELRDMLARPALEQLAQRMIARYHLQALSLAETSAYIAHRLSVSGLKAVNPFTRSAQKMVHKITRGIPRRINLLCDRAMLGAYAGHRQQIDAPIVKQAALEIFGNVRDLAQERTRRRIIGWSAVAAMLAVGVAVGVLFKLPAGQSAVGNTANAAVGTSAAAAPGTAGTAALADLSLALNDASRDETRAYRELIGLWDLNIAGGIPCIVARASGLHCYRSSGGFAELQVLDRPALLTLYDGAGQAHFALLTALTNHAATLKIGDGIYQVSPLVLARHFRGGFATLWRTPPGFDLKIDQGDAGPAVDWLATQLHLVSGGEARQQNQAFDQALAKTLREFQASQGLRPDGIAGPRTLMLVNRAAGVEEPRLAGDAGGK